MLPLSNNKRLNFGVRVGTEDCNKVYQFFYDKVLKENRCLRVNCQNHSLYYDIKINIFAVC